MRTTLTLDEDVAHQLTELAHSTRKPFKQVLNETLRRGLSAAPARRPPFKVKPFHVAFAPGLDEGHLGKLYDEMEVDQFLQKSRKSQ